MHTKKISLAIVAPLILFSLISAPVYAQKNNRQQRNESSSVVVSESNKAELVYLYQEEKLARDLYTKLYEKWGLNVFKNISKSEQKHMNSVANLAKKASVQLPTNLAVGKFENSDLQNLYNKLLTDGMASKEAAIKVGILVEETDIKDLQKTLSNSSDSSVKKVLNSLLKGSERHLKAFKNNL